MKEKISRSVTYKILPISGTRLFEIENYLPEPIYTRLVRGFRAFDAESTIDAHVAGGKQFVSSRSGIENQAFKDVVEYFRSEKVCNEIKEIYSRIDSKAESWVFLNPEPSYSLLLIGWAKLKRRLFGVRSIRIDVEFTRLRGSKTFIPPHTDVPSKAFSLVLYCPAEEACVNSREAFGTEFYEPLERSSEIASWESSYNGADFVREFLEKYRVGFCSTYDENKLIGFVKTSFSWHGVCGFDSSYEVDRDAIVVNGFYV